MKKAFVTICSLFIFYSQVTSQTIPNAGFENWTNMGSYSNPNGWDQLNSLTSLAGIYTCEQGSPGIVGSHYLKLTSKTAGALGVAPGVAVSGLIDVATQQPKSGFAFTGQPQTLTGKWQHMIFGSSQGYVDVKLTKWNSSNNTRTTVASGHVDLTGMAMSWANFSVPLAYLETFAPDSCIISLAASGTTPTNNDYLWVDELAFTGSVTSLIVNNSGNAIRVFPNPSSSILSIDLASLNTPTVQIMIFDIKGNLVIDMSKVATKTNNTINISELAEGNYVLNVISEAGLISKKFTKN